MYRVPPIATVQLPPRYPRLQALLARSICVSPAQTWCASLPLHVAGPYPTNWLGGAPPRCSIPASLGTPERETCRDVPGYRSLVLKVFALPPPKRTAHSSRTMLRTHNKRIGSGKRLQGALLRSRLDPPDEKNTPTPTFFSHKTEFVYSIPTVRQRATSRRNEW